MHEPCVVARESETLHRYVAGTLSPGEVEEFEIHLLECDRCQAAVREGVAVSLALQAGDGASPARPGRVVWWTSLVAVAAALAALLLWPPGPLERLGAVSEPPAFRGMAVRTDPGEADRLAAYREGEWERAAELLASAIDLHPEPALHFFRGVSLLMAGANEGAAAALTVALEPTDGPYAREARLYLAKALLRQGRGEEALVHLDAAASGLGAGVATETARHAAALADSVREALAR